MEDKKNESSPGEKHGTPQPYNGLMTPSGIPLLFTILCGLGLVFLFSGSLLSNLTLQTGTEPDVGLYANDTAYYDDLEEYYDQQEASNEGYRNGLVLYNVGLFFLAAGLLGGAFFSLDIKWELRAALILATGLVLGFGNFQL